MVWHLWVASLKDRFVLVGVLLIVSICIAAHLQIGGSIGIPAASFTIVRRLFKISRMRGVATSKSEVCSAVCSSLGGWTYTSSNPVAETKRAACRLIDMPWTSIAGYVVVCVLFLKSSQFTDIVHRHHHPGTSICNLWTHWLYIALRKYAIVLCSRSYVATFAWTMLNRVMS